MKTAHFQTSVTLSDNELVVKVVSVDKGEPVESFIAALVRTLQSMANEGKINMLAVAEIATNLPKATEAPTPPGRDDQGPSA